MWLKAPVIVKTNRERCTINYSRAVQFAKARNIVLVRWPSQYKKWEGKPENESDVAEMIDHDSAFWDFFVPEGPCYLTDTISKERKLCNGTRAEYQSLILDDVQLSVYQHQVQNKDQTVITLSDPPLGINIKINDSGIIGATNWESFETYPEGNRKGAEVVVPIRPGCCNSRDRQMFNKSPNLLLGPSRVTTNKAKSSFTIYCGPQETAVAKITVAYVAYYLGSGFVAKCLAFGKRCADSNLNQPSFIVPLGDSNFDTAPDSCLCKLDKNGARVKILRFVQGASNCCLGFLLANALHHLNFHEEADSLYRWSHELSKHNATVQFKKLSRWVQTLVKGVTCLSFLESRKFDRLDGLLQCISLLREQDLVVFVPQANDGTKTHAVTFCCGLIFDSTQQYPLRLSEESLKFIAGFAGIWRARLFRFGK
ncbi:unnamed protein product [Cylindrotheca closterium]|uniref:Uncharacterized protein n=1 Tax=Cylindrotheca closterium TaxID=2856 RepID=A0AAD2FVU4_9STRA|nr:unnamed protein product [Cylindrotheca closterium]